MNLHQAALRLQAVLDAADAGKCDYPDFGICGALDVLIRRDRNSFNTGEAFESELHDIFRAWPDFSGSLIFPVTAPEYPTAQDAYYSTIGAERWVGTEYAEARRDLLTFIIDQTNGDDK